MPDLPTQLGTALRFISSSKFPIALPGASIETVLLSNFSLSNPVSFLFLHHEPIPRALREISCMPIFTSESTSQETQLVILTGISNTDGLLNMNLSRG